MAAQGAFGTDFYDRSILRPKHRAYYSSGRPVIKSVPNAPWAAMRSAKFTPPQASYRVYLYLSFRKVRISSKIFIPSVKYVFDFPSLDIKISHSDRRVKSWRYNHQVRENVRKLYFHGEYKVEAAEKCYWCQRIMEKSNKKPNNWSYVRFVVTSHCVQVRRVKPSYCW